MVDTDLQVLGYFIHLHRPGLSGTHVCGSTKGEVTGLQKTEPSVPKSETSCNHKKKSSSGGWGTSETTSRCLETTDCTEEFFTNVGPGECSDHKVPKYILKQGSSEVKYEDGEDVSSTEGLQGDDWPPSMGEQLKMTYLQQVEKSVKWRPSSTSKPEVLVKVWHHPTLSLDEHPEFPQHREVAPRVLHKWSTSGPQIVPALHKWSAGGPQVVRKWSTCSPNGPSFPSCPHGITGNRVKKYLHPWSSVFTKSGDERKVVFFFLNTCNSGLTFVYGLWLTP